MNYILKSLLIFSISFLMACSPNIYYLDPELKGVLYDAATGKPIVNQEGYAAFHIGLDEEGNVKTNNEGKFTIQATPYTYYIFKPNLRNESMSPPYIYINFKGYQGKIYDYSPSLHEQNTEPNPGAKRLNKVDVGIIYLDPES